MSLGRLMGFFLALTIASIVSTLFATTADAAAARTDAWNTQEQNARNLCGSARRGAIWISATGSTAYSPDGYYNSAISVPASASSITVYIRGSVVNCAYAEGGRTYARSITPQGGNAWRLTGLSNTTLYRGTSPGVKYAWSSQGSQVTASLNVSGLATNNQNGATSQTIYIDLYRCFSTQENRTTGSCYPETIPLTITRAAEPFNWKASASSEINKNGGSYTTSTQIAKPGDKISFRHTVQNTGPTKTNKTVRGSTNVSGGKTLPGLSNVTFLSSGAASGTTVGRTTSDASIDQSFVSDTAVYCQSLTAAPQSSSSDGGVTSSARCFRVPYDYTLTPNIPIGVPDDLEPEGTIPSVSGSISNSGPTKTPDSTIWQLTQYIGNERGALKGTTAPCGTSGQYAGSEYGIPGNTCKSLRQGGGSIGTGGVTVSASNVQIDDFEVGTTVCFVLSVKQASSGDARWSHSAARCLTVSKKPKVQVIGGDLWVGRGTNRSNISTGVTIHTSPDPDEVFGSYSEYAVVASGNVIGMASGSGYEGGAPSSRLCNGLNLLTLNNATDSVCSDAGHGSYTNLPVKAPDVAARFPASNAGTVSGTVNLSSRSAGIYKATGTITLSSATIQKGKWIVINAPTATVNISGNITYTDAELSGLEDIPQLVIIAQNIYIAESVTQVDAWLIASNATGSGLVNTCDATGVNRTTGAGLTSEKCKDRLTVNGPVVTDHLYLRRTAGAGTGKAAGDPAEVFNLRPDAYLWASYRAQQAGQATSMLTYELPVKY